MKNLFERMKHYSFWLSFSGALIVFLNCLGKIFGFEIENEIVESCVMSVAGLLVVFGLVTKDNCSKGENGNNNDAANQTEESSENVGDDENKVSDNVDDVCLENDENKISENTNINANEENLSEESDKIKDDIGEK